MVVPSAATPLADGMTVVVASEGFASPVVMAPQDVGAWVMEGADGPSAKLAVPSTEDWFLAEPSIGPSRTVAATVVVLGKDHDVVTNAATVRELLSAMGIEPDDDDRVQPSPRTPLHDGMEVRYARVAIRVHDVEVPIPYTTHTIYSDDLYRGQVRVTRQGRNGLMVETYRVRIVNGEVVGRVLLERRVVHRGRLPAPRVGRDNTIARHRGR